ERRFKPVAVESRGRARFVIEEDAELIACDVVAAAGKEDRVRPAAREPVRRSWIARTRRSCFGRGISSVVAAPGCARLRISGFITPIESRCATTSVLVKEIALPERDSRTTSRRVRAEPAGPVARVRLPPPGLRDPR